MSSQSVILFPQAALEVGDLLPAECIVRALAQLCGILRAALGSDNIPCRLQVHILGGIIEGGREVLRLGDLLSSSS